MCARSQLVRRAWSSHRFQEEYELGAGCTAKVMKATDRLTGQTRAIKVIGRRWAHSDQHVQREISILEAADHPAILKLYGTFIRDNSVCLVTEICPGGDLLSAVLDTGHFREIQAAVVMRQLLSAVKFLQACCISHADIKPENVLLSDSRPTEDTLVKLADFGSAHVFLPDMPERSDLWACGAVLRFLLCSASSFKSQPEVPAVSAGPWVTVGSCRFPAAEWAHVSAPAQELCGGLLTRDISSRWTAERALQHAWLRPLGRLPVAHKAPLVAGAADERLPRFLSELSVLQRRWAEFGRAQAFRRSVLLAVADQLNATDVVGLRHIFATLDTDGDGLLSAEDLRLSIGRLGLGSCDASPSSCARQLQDDLLVLDPDGLGVLDFTTFLAASLDVTEHVGTAAMKAAFHVFDPKGSGNITWPNVAEVVSCPQALDPAVENRRRTARRVVSLGEVEVDANGDEVIDYTCFTEIFKSSSDGAGCHHHPLEVALEEVLLLAQHSAAAVTATTAPSSSMVPPLTRLAKAEASRPKMVLAEKIEDLGSNDSDGTDSCSTSFRWEHDSSTDGDSD